MININFRVDILKYKSIIFVLLQYYFLAALSQSSALIL